MDPPVNQPIVALVKSETHLLVVDADGHVWSPPEEGISPRVAAEGRDLIIVWGVPCCSQHFAPIGNYWMSLN